MLKRFITPVNRAGLPIAWQTFEYTGSENCQNYTPKEIASLYWLLQSINLSYDLSFNELRIQDTITLDCPTLPHERILTPPIFHYQSFQSHNTLVSSKLDLYNINHPPLFNDTYGFSLYFELTHSHFPDFFISCHPKPSYFLNHTYYSSFMDHTLPFFLYTLNPEVSSFIHNIDIQPLFYQYPPLDSIE